MKNTRAIVVILIAVTVSVTQEINIRGRVSNTRGVAICKALVALEKEGLFDTTNADGSFSLSGTISNLTRRHHGTLPYAFTAKISNGQVFLTVTEKSIISIALFSLQGEPVSTIQRPFKTGTHTIALPKIGTAVYLCKIASGGSELLFKIFSIEGAWLGPAALVQSFVFPTPLMKQAHANTLINDVLTIKATGYFNYRMAVSNPDTGGMEIQLIVEAVELPKFSFFVTSLKALLALSGKEEGFGGDLRFGETGPGAGLRGADKICATIAERSMPGSSFKEWRAFLSVSADENGDTVHARDRIGKGPWYDRIGRLLSPTLDDLLNTRPQKGNPAIANDLPNEDGVPNHNPDGTGIVNNKYTLTGTNEDGTLFIRYNKSATCEDWTSTTVRGNPKVGCSWVRVSYIERFHWFSTRWMGLGCGAGNFSKVYIDPGTVAMHGYGGFYCFALSP